MEEQDMKRRNHMRGTRRRERGQSFMEFALTLPILLLVTLGIFDFGRALFTYAEASNALRTALRYGAILGFQANGMPQYTDCRGMIDIARHISFATPSTTITVSYIEDIYKDGNASVSPADAKQFEGEILQCTYRNRTYTIPTLGKIERGVDNGAVILITTEANVSMVTPVFPRFMPVSIQGIRTLVRDIELARCGDGIWANTETCWNCAKDMGVAPAGADPGVCLLAEPDIVGTVAADFNHIVLTWNNVVDYDVLGHAEDKYLIQYVKTTSGAWPNRAVESNWLNVPNGSTPGETDEDIVTLTLTGLTCSNSEKYQFRVKAIDENPNSPQETVWFFSDEVTLFCSGGGAVGGSIGNGNNGLNTRPNPISTNSTNSTSITVTFNDNSDDETNFYVYRIVSPADPTNPLSWPAQNVPTYTVAAAVGMDSVLTFTDTTGIDCTKTYYYRVAAHRQSGSNHYYSYYTAYKAQAPYCLPAPTITVLQTSPNDSTNTVRYIGWADVGSGTTVASYVVERSRDGGVTWEVMTTTITDSNVAGYVWDDSAEANSAMSCFTYADYRYRVRSKDSGTIYSDYSNIAIYPREGTCTAPGAPDTASAYWSASNDGTSTSSITIKFTDRSGNEYTTPPDYGFEIRRSSDGGANWVVARTEDGRAGTGTEITWVDSGLSCGVLPGTTYYYQIFARGPGGYSAPVTVNATVFCPPGTLTLGCNSSMAERGYPRISWTSVVGAALYRLEAASQISGPSWTNPPVFSSTLLQCQNTPSDSTNYCFKDSPSTYTPGQTFYYRVRACINNVAGTVCSWARVPSPAFNQCNP